MTSYYVNIVAQANGEHEVHRYGCPYTPPEDIRIELGEFLLCRMALNEACRRFERVHCCAHCVPELRESLDDPPQNADAVRVVR
jgi:hypothetical protein